MSEDLKSFIFREINDHLDKMEDLIADSESDYEMMEYHLDKIRSHTEMLKGA